MEEFLLPFWVCRYKDQELAAMEHMQRSQRPDIIEREVMAKSPPPREEHHSIPQPTHHSQHGHDSNQSHGHTDNDLPEHYDLENSSSIAPSDIDIICHYKSKYAVIINGQQGWTNQFESQSGPKRFFPEL